MRLVRIDHKKYTQLSMSRRPYIDFTQTELNKITKEIILRNFCFHWHPMQGQISYWGGRKGIIIEGVITRIDEGDFLVYHLEKATEEPIVTTYKLILK